MTEAKKQAGSTAAGFSAEERAAMKQRAAELKAEARRSSGAEKAAAAEEAVMAKIAGMQEPDREMAERLHAIVTKAAPELTPKLYYGQPGWAKDGKVIVFFRSGIDDKARYSTLGFSVSASLDDDSGWWPTSYALKHITNDSAELIARLVRAAVR
ncbi:DUF1801 domain-containing protein [Subtercola endophyticus]|uniref:DUF1801 domain-containing protein n=1 Tax=Subtercola endophyticus TaxID=2895559 RepID=UPI001E357635|nr:DUF1801 domain-containing protein [Subtercola endophyticus]UFS60675.1 DUF1801 domain-containing protein [Subtercola endophyticus]